MLSHRLRCDLEELIEREKPRRFGPIDGRPFVDVVPEFLIELWKSAGAASWADGSYQTIDPALCRSAVEHALEGSPIDAERLVPYLMYAFGRLIGWHAVFGLVEIDPVEVTVTILADPRHRVDGDIEVSSAFIGMDGDATNFGLYRAAVRKCGPLGENEIFAFVPALSLGGRATIRSVVKQAADIQLDILCQSATFRTLRVEGGFPDARIVPVD